MAFFETKVILDICMPSVCGICANTIGYHGTLCWVIKLFSLTTWKLTKSCFVNNQPKYQYNTLRLNYNIITANMNQQSCVYVTFQIPSYLSRIYFAPQCSADFIVHPINDQWVSLPDHTRFLLPRQANNASKPMTVSHDQFRIVVFAWTYIFVCVCCSGKNCAK